MSNQFSRSIKYANGLTPKIISAAQYYQGKPDGQYFSSTDFPKEVVYATKSYITLNTLMGSDNAEKERFLEGKRHIPGIITSKGIQKIMELYNDLFLFGLNNPAEGIETLRACKRISEVNSGTVSSLMSTTKKSIDEIYNLGYGNKVELAVCNYILHSGAIVFDMEKLGKNYLVPEEREVLILPGNRFSSEQIGKDSKHKGKDGKDAIVYNIDVYPPKLDKVKDNEKDLKSFVFNEDIIEKVRNFYEQLNQNIKTGEYPIEPDEYRSWKKAYMKLIFQNLYKLTQEFRAEKKSKSDPKRKTQKKAPMENEL